MREQAGKLIIAALILIVPASDAWTFVGKGRRQRSSTMVPLHASFTQEVATGLIPPENKNDDNNDDKAIWFGKLADGTEAAMTDLVFQDLSVVQATRIRIPKLLSHEETMQVLQHTRQRYPELNREENPSLFAPSRISRVNLPDDVAAESVGLSIASQSSSVDACREEVVALMNQNVQKHPSSFSRLGWRVDILHAAPRDDDAESGTNSDDNNDIAAWMVISITHNAADGVALLTMIDDFLQGYSDVLAGKSLSQRARLPLHSALPRDRIPLKRRQRIGYGFAGWLASFLLGTPEFPGPKLLTPEAAKAAKETVAYRAENGISQYEGPMHVDFLEIDNTFVSELRTVARSAGLTVGALVQSAFFLAIAERYFAEHPNKNELSHKVPMSVNMRPYLQPPLAADVLTPQQGDVDVVLKTSRAEMENSKLDPSVGRALLFALAKEGRQQVQEALAKPEMFTPLHGDIFLSSLFRNGQKKMQKQFQYIGDSWFSNVGLYKPSVTTTDNNVRVESTLTLNRGITPAYELMWCNTVVGGAMTLSMVTDETMGRNRESVQKLLQQVRCNLESSTTVLVEVEQ